MLKQKIQAILNVSLKKYQAFLMLFCFMGTIFFPSNGSYGASVNDGAFGQGAKKKANPILSRLGASLGFNSQTGFSATANMSLTGRDPNHNPKTFGGLSLTADRTGVNLGVSVSGANLLNSHSVHGFSVNTNFAADAQRNQIMSRANEEFDAEMEKRQTKAEDDYITKQTKGKVDPSKLSDSERTALLKKIGAKDPKNEAAGSSRLTDESKAFGEIADGFRNLGTAFGLGNRTTGASGFVDADGKFHPRTCFTKGTLVTKLKSFGKLKELRISLNEISTLKPNSIYEEKVAIEEIKSGDYVLSYNESNGKNEYKKVVDAFTRTTESIYTITYSTGEKIETTWNHRFYINAKKNSERGPPLGVSLYSAINESKVETEGSWIQAKDLKVGDISLTSKGKSVLIESIKTENKKEIVYNFTVADNSTYYVGYDGVLVHNDPGCLQFVELIRGWESTTASTKSVEMIEKPLKSCSDNPSSCVASYYENIGRGMLLLSGGIEFKAAHLLGKIPFFREAVFSASIGRPIVQRTLVPLLNNLDIKPQLEHDSLGLEISVGSSVLSAKGKFLYDFDEKKFKTEIGPSFGNKKGQEYFVRIKPSTLEYHSTGYKYKNKDVLYGTKQ